MRISETASWMCRWMVRRSGRAPGEEPLLGLARDLHLEAPLGQRLVDVGEEDVDDRAQLLLAQWVEDDHLVDAVDELRAEAALELGQDLLLDALEAGLGVLLAEA